MFGGDFGKSKKKENEREFLSFFAKGTKTFQGFFFFFFFDALAAFEGLDTS